MVTGTIDVTISPDPSSTQSHSFQMVALADINIPAPYDQVKLDAIRSQDLEAFRQSVLTVVLEEGCQIEGAITFSLTHGQIIQLSKCPGEDKYTIEDGIHRMNVAREREMTHVLAFVTMLDGRNSSWWRSNG